MPRSAWHDKLIWLVIALNLIFVKSHGFVVTLGKNEENAKKITFVDANYSEEENLLRRSKREPQHSTDSLASLRANLEALDSASHRVPVSFLSPGKANFYGHQSLFHGPLLPGRDLPPPMGDIKPPHLAIDQNPFFQQRLMRLLENRARARRLFLPSSHLEREHSLFRGDVFPQAYHVSQRIESPLSRGIDSYATNNDFLRQHLTSDATIPTSAASELNHHDGFFLSPDHSGFIASMEGADLSHGHQYLSHSDSILLPERTGEFHNLANVDREFRNPATSDREFHDIANADGVFHTMGNADRGFHNMASADRGFHNMANADRGFHNMANADREFHNMASADATDGEYFARHSPDLRSSFQHSLSGELARHDPSLDGNRLLQGSEVDRPFENVGSLGDETEPFGSLGEMKPAEAFIPVEPATGADGNDEPNSPADSASSDVPFKKERKTWVTDVNVYSKKKTMDDPFSDDDDDDPFDDYDPCESKPCRNGGLCKAVGRTGYSCLCSRTYKGKHCEFRSQCHPNPCAHGSKCTETTRGVQCSCAVGFKGPRCKERNYCLPNPCTNNGVCSESDTGDLFSCSCQSDYVGKVCETRRNSCTPSPCQNHAECIPDGLVSFTCVCQRGTSGKLCQDGALQTYDSSLESIASLLHVDGQHVMNVEKSAIQVPSKGDLASRFACIANPCMNGAVCRADSSIDRGYMCDCPEGYLGILCEEKKCKCQNGGSCIGEGLEVRCKCVTGYAGVYCAEHTQCNEDTCLHGGVCLEEVGGFRCKCDKGYQGSRCEQFDKCQPNPCLHGARCRSYGDFYKCDCRPGYRGKQCEDLDFCRPNPCANGGQCYGYPGGFQCECLPGFSGKTCTDNLYCNSNPCLNGAECVEVMKTDSLMGHFKCLCRGGFVGDTCGAQDHCYVNPCMNGGTCRTQNDGFLCTCTDKFKGAKCETLNLCASSPCKNGGRCISEGSSYKCLCSVGYQGPNCEEADYCQPSPCKNHGVCAASTTGPSFVCNCITGYRGLTCEDLDPCLPNPCLHGVCEEIHGGFLCNCTTGFKGATCSELNRCDPNPCFHSGTCHGIVGGPGFLCQCPLGYRGQMCELKDMCHPEPCHNGGTCIPQYLYESSSPISVSENFPRFSSDLGYSCSCAQGFLGQFCEKSDPCFPNPCLHNSNCIAVGSSKSCNCSTGWKGKHCEALDLCNPDPCRFGTHCIQTDEESYQCVKNLCTPSPCKHSGKCIVINDESYECACQKGWRGHNCEDVDACYPNPCENQGTCSISDQGFICECPVGFQGIKCQGKDAPEKAHFCTTYPCKNGGTCIDTEGGFTCRCVGGYSGTFCEENVCDPNPCMNAGTCVPYYGIALCKCAAGFTGSHCAEGRQDRRENTAVAVYPGVDAYTSGRANLAGHAQHEHHRSAITAEEASLTGPSLKRDRKIQGGSLLQTSASERTTSLSSDDIPPRAGPPPGYASSETSNVRPVSERKPIVEITKKQDPCEPNLCRNGGSCIVRSDGIPQCICPDNFSGPRCAEIGALGYSSAPKFFPQDECLHCDKEANCVNGHCICRSGFVGDGLECWLETTADRSWSCETNPCQNGGTCKVGQAKCVCRLGFTGTLCEHYCPPVAHLSFDRMSGAIAVDESGNHNDALLSNGAEIIYGGGKCGSGVSLLGGDILFQGRSFSPKPVEAVTMAVWVKLDTNRGIQSIFDTVGGKASSHKEGQYHLEIDDGRVRWFHRNEHHVTIFSVLSQPVLPEGNWTHIVGTYSSATGVAKLYVNGDAVGMDNGNGYLSQDWDGKAGIGRHEHTFGNRLLRGMVDEFYVFGCALPRLEILVLMHHCKIYWKPPQQSQQPTVPSATPPSNFLIFTPVDAVPGIFTAQLTKGSNSFQNYYGFQVNPNSPAPRKVNTQTPEVAGQRKDSLDLGNGYTKSIVSRPEGLSLEETARAGVKTRVPVYPNPTLELMKAIPHGPSALVHEIRDLLSPHRTISPDKRMQIVAMEKTKYEEMRRRLYLKSKQLGHVHRAPVMKSDNKALPFASHAYFNSPQPPVIQAGPGITIPAFAVKSSLPSVHASPTSSDLSWFFSSSGAKSGMSMPRPLPARTRNSPFSDAAAKYSTFPKSFANFWAVWKKRQKDMLDARGPVVSPFAAWFKPSTVASDLRPPARQVIPVINPQYLLWKKMEEALNRAKTDAEVSSRASMLLPTSLQNSGVGPFVRYPGSDSLSYEAYRKAHPTRNYYKLSESEAYNRWMQWQNNLKTFWNAAVAPIPPALPQGVDNLGQPDPRWFKWKQGAAAVNGGTVTHTHSSTTQTNSPGTASTQTHVSSSQNAGGSTNIKNYFPTVAGLPDIRTMWNRFVEQQKQLQASKRQSTSKMHSDSTNIASSSVNINPANAGPVRVHSHQWGFGNGNGNGNGIGSPGGRGSGGGWGAGGPTSEHVYLPNPNQSPWPPPWMNVGQTQQRQIFTTSHRHQWGYGSGNGQGNGIGTPGGSGSGGGWGAGGPLSQNLSLPGWSGNPGDGPPWGEKAQEKLKQVQAPRQRHVWTIPSISSVSKQGYPWSVGPSSEAGSMNPLFGNMQTSVHAILKRSPRTHLRESMPSSYQSAMLDKLREIPDGPEAEAIRSQVIDQTIEDAVKHYRTLKRRRRKI